MRRAVRFPDGLVLSGALQGVGAVIILQAAGFIRVLVSYRTASGWSRLHTRNMHDRNAPIVMWQFKNWRCEYEPGCDASGRLVVYAGPDAVIERRSASGVDAHARALALRVLAEMTDLRHPIGMRPTVG